MFHRPSIGCTTYRAYTGAGCAAFARRALCYGDFRRYSRSRREHSRDGRTVTAISAGTVAGGASSRVLDALLRRFPPVQVLVARAFARRALRCGGFRRYCCRRRKQPRVGRSVTAISAGTGAGCASSRATDDLLRRTTSLLEWAADDRGDDEKNGVTIIFYLISAK